jgi:hypothetical protein
MKKKLGRKSGTGIMMEREKTESMAAMRKKRGRKEFSRDEKEKREETWAGMRKERGRKEMGQG